MKHQSLIVPVNYDIITQVIKALPVSKNRRDATHLDAITTQLWWILHPSFLRRKYQRDDQWFSISKKDFYDSYYTNNNSEEDFLIEPLVTDFLIDQWFLPLKQPKVFARHTRIIRWIVNQPGMAFEYFLIDYLARHPRITDQYRLEHRKWPYILDQIVKVDFVSHLSWLHSPISATFWTQVHFQHIKKSFGEVTKSPLKKEIDVLEWIEENQDIVNCLPAHLSPQIPSFINISSVPFLQENWDGKFTLFLDAFKTRETLWYHSWWPTEHLPESLKEFLSDMTYFYQKSCMSVTNLLVYQIIWRWNYSSFQTRTEHKNAIRINTYNSEHKRMVYDFYSKSWEKKLIATITFNLIDSVIDKIWQIIGRNV